MANSTENSKQPAFRIRQEPFEDDSFSLELTNIQFCVTNDSVTLQLTSAFWEALRQRQPADVSWADATDEDIRRHAEVGVTERAHLQQTRGAGLAHLMDPGNYERFGEPELSPAEQVARGIAYFQGLRARHQALRVEIAAFDAANRP